MAMLTRNDKILCGTYGVVAVVALIATWWNNIGFFTTESTSLIDFFRSGYANYGSSSLTNDLLLIGPGRVRVHGCRGAPDRHPEGVDLHRAQRGHRGERGVSTVSDPAAVGVVGGATGIPCGSVRA